jgi:hypothetical protein
MVFLGDWRRSVGIVFAEGLCDWGGITSAEGIRDGETGRAPFLIMPWHSPYNWGKGRNTSVSSAGQHRDCSLRRLGCLLRDCLGWPAGRQITPVSRLTSVSPRSAQLPSELPYWGFPAWVNFESKLSISALMWSAKYVIPKSSWICL